MSAVPSTTHAAPGAPSLASRLRVRSQVLDRPLVIAAIMLSLLPPIILSKPYNLNLFVLMCIYAVVNISWNLIMGYAGIWSFGQLALFALGGYTSAILTKHYEWNPFLATIAAAFLAMAASLVIGLPSLRLKGAYVFLLTLGFHEILRTMILTDASEFTKGQFGLTGYEKYGINEMRAGVWLINGIHWIRDLFDQPATKKSFDRMIVDYYVALALLFVTGLVIWRLLRSPLGLAFRALRDGEAYAISRGVPEFRFKLIVFAVSAFFTGLIGAFYAHFIGSISPATLSFGLMMELVAMIVIGGIGTFWGPIIGTILLMYAKERLRDLETWRVLIFGLLMTSFAILLPQGLVMPLGKIKDRVASLVDRRPRATGN